MPYIDVRIFSGAFKIKCDRLEKLNIYIEYMFRIFYLLLFCVRTVSNNVILMRRSVLEIQFPFHYRSYISKIPSMRINKFCYFEFSRASCEFWIYLSLTLFIIFRLNITWVLPSLATFLFTAVSKLLDLLIQ